MKKIFFISLLLSVMGLSVLPFSVKASDCTSYQQDTTITTSCAFSGTINGVDKGTGSSNTGKITIQSGVLTINSNQSISAGEIVLTGGSIALNGAIKLNTPLWMTDADNDGYPDSSTMYAQTNTPTNGKRINSIAHPSSTDCYGGNANVFSGQTAYFSVERGDGSFDYDCDGVETKEFTSTYNCNQTSCDVHHYTVATGWNGSVPACGVSGTYYTASTVGTCLSTACTYTSASKTQSCR